MGKILGIDLGTTNSAMAIMEAGEPKIIENAEGNRTTPSIVAISKGGERLVGQLAKRQAVTNPENTVFGIKRFIGHDFDDTAVQRDKDIVPYTIEKSGQGGVEITLGGKKYRPEEISAMILQKMKTDAEAKLGETITEAVITVPAYFNDSQRKATKDAGKIAGLDVKRIINEPTAAALSYGFNEKKDQKIAVFDFGGGTFDMSILEVGDEVVEVKATEGDSHLGGKDIDQRIIDHLVNEFKKESGIDISKDKLALQRLDESAEKAKIELSSTQESEVNIPFITSDADGPKHLMIKLTRSKLEELAQEFIDRAMTITENSLKSSKFSKDDIDEVVLVGGQTRMPKIQERVKEFFGKEPNKTINPDEVVALGAAIQGGIIGGDVKDVLLLDVTPLTLGIETMGGVSTPLIERNSTIPTQQTQTFSTAADNQPSVEIHVLQGERPMAADNKSLGRFILDGIPPAPRGTPQIEVSFDVDANGILNVTAKDKASGKEQSIRIEATSGLSEEDIQKMQKEAEEHADEDKKRKEAVEARNIAEQLIYTAEKSLSEHKDKVPGDVQKSIQEKIDAAKAARDKEDNDAAVIQQATEELSAELQKIGQHVQQESANAEAQSQPKADSDQSKTDENVRDAEYEENADENKSEDNDSNEESKGESEQKDK
ncbi:MAG: molecular chaperone DnaK [Candidatus Paceibacterota bacterium]